jgi:hypothetical protein
MVTNKRKAVLFRCAAGLAVKPTRWAYLTLENERTVIRRCFGVLMQDKQGKIVAPARQVMMQFTAPSPSVVTVQAVAAPVSAPALPAILSSARQKRMPVPTPQCVVLVRSADVALPHWKGGFWDARCGFVRTKK